MADKCKIIGSFGKHKVPEGWMGGPPYLNISGVIVDGVGVKHATLTAECDRCGKIFNVAMVHLP